MMIDIQEMQEFQRYRNQFNRGFDTGQIAEKARVPEWYVYNGLHRYNRWKRGEAGLLRLSGRKLECLQRASIGWYKPNARYLQACCLALHENGWLERDPNDSQSWRATEEGRRRLELAKR